MKKLQSPRSLRRRARTKRVNHSTLISVEYFNFHDRKIRMELRESRNGYTVSLVGRGSFPLAHIVNVLRKNGFETGFFSFDRWGYVHVVYRGISESDLLVMRNIISSEIRVKKSRSSDVDIELLV